MPQKLYISENSPAMWLLYILLLLVLIVVLTPKGNILYELLRIPVYWWHLMRAPADQMVVEKHFFGPNWRQYLLYCRPEKEQGKDKPQVIMYFHGGGWSLGSPEFFLSKARFFTVRGYHVILPSHRRIPRYSYPHIREDLNLCLKKSMALMQKHGQVDKKLIIGGMSAGGNVAALLALDRQQLAQIGLSPSLFSGLMLFGAPLDLTRMPQSPVVWAYAGPRQAPMFQAASPYSHIQGDETLPVFCIHGDKDGMVPLAAATRFITKYQENKAARLEFHLLEEGIHVHSGYWSVFENREKQQLLQWLKKLENI